MAVLFTVVAELAQHSETFMSYFPSHHELPLARDHGLTVI